MARAEIDDIEREVCPASMTSLCIEKIDFKETYFEIKWEKYFFEKSKLPLRKDIFKIPISSQLLR